MRSIVLLLFIGLVSGGFAPDQALQDTPEPVNRGFAPNQALQDTPEPVNSDNYVDMLVNLAGDFLVNAGMDPFPMEDISQTFSVKPFIITLHAEMYLTNGCLHGISNIRRCGESDLNFRAMCINLKVPLEFEAISAVYDYDIGVMGLLNRRGSVEVRISNLRLYIDIVMDMITLEPSLQQFEVTHTGPVDVTFSGHPWTDWLANTVAKLATTFLHNMIHNQIATILRTIVENVINEIKSQPHHSLNFPCLN